jgi:hypothetical protein
MWIVIAVSRRTGGSASAERMMLPFVASRTPRSPVETGAARIFSALPAVGASASSIVIDEQDWPVTRVSVASRRADFVDGQIRLSKGTKGRQALGPTFPLSAGAI